MMYKLHIWLSLWVICAIQGLDQNGDPFTPGSYGKNVVLSTLRLVDEAEIFQDDRDFALNVARLRTNYGRKSSTFKPGNGGIWQVDEMIFNITKDVEKFPSLMKLHKQIKEAFGIVWMKVVMEDLAAPLPSVLALKITFETFNSDGKAASKLPTHIRNIVKRETPSPVPGPSRPSPSPTNPNPTVTTTTTTTARVPTGPVVGPSRPPTPTPTPDPASMKGDPHVTLPVSGSDTPLCFDLTGDGFYNILNDIDDGGAMIKAGLTPVSSAAYTLEVKIENPQLSIDVDTRVININGKSYSWKDTSSIKTGTLRAQLAPNAANFSINGLNISIERQKEHFLDTSIAHAKPFGEKATGIFGDLSQALSIKKKSDGEYLVLKNADEPMLMAKLTLHGKCWKFDKTSDIKEGIDDIVEKNKIGKDKRGVKKTH